jgi:inner membrane transporter RhtA
MVASATSLYGGASLAVRLFDQLGVAGAAWLRVAWATAILLAWRRGRFDRHPPPVLIAYGVAMGVMNLSIYLAWGRLPLGTAVAIEFLGPITVAAVGGRTRRHLLAVALAAVGVGALSGAEVTRDWFGLAMVGIAAFTWGLYIVLGARSAAALAHVPVLDRLLIAQFVASVVISPFGLVSLARTNPTWWAVLAAAGIGLMSSAIPYALDQVLLGRVGAAAFGLLCTVLPVVATVIGFVVLSQRPSPMELLGIGLVCLALAVGNSTSPVRQESTT